MQVSALLHRLQDDLANPADQLTLAQLGIVATSLLLGWIVTRVVAQRVTCAGKTPAAFTDLQSALIALISWLGIVAARAAWDAVRNKSMLAITTPILDLTLQLLIAFVIIRALVYALRRIFNPHPVLRASERLISFTIWLGFALHLLGVLAPVARYLNALSVTIGKQQISLLTVLQGAAAVAATILVAMWLSRWFERRIATQTGLDLSLRAVLTRFVRAALIFLAVLIALPLVGIDITALSVFGGALGVGIGFGLQKIASNYMSGFIILLERSIRPGDLITVDQRYGVVSQINSRYTVVRSLDGTEAVVPNETLITSTVVNHSYSNRRVALTVPVSIAYQSDLEQALAIIERVTREQPRVLREPGPAAFVKNFGDNGIELELGAWIADPELGLAPLRSDILRAIWREFQAQKIEIPYPRREVRILPSDSPTVLEGAGDQPNT